MNKYSLFLVKKKIVNVIVQFRLTKLMIIFLGKNNY